MKKIVLAFALTGLAAFAGSFTGVVSDAGCGAKHADGSEASLACIKRCAGRGSALVLVVGDEVHKIADASKDKLKDHLGHKVTISGKEEGGAIVIDSVEMAK